jgi:hypothetical protein
VTGNVGGNVAGKVLGGGSGTITGIGGRADVRQFLGVDWPGGYVPGVPYVDTTYMNHGMVRSDTDGDGYAVPHVNVRYFGGEGPYVTGIDTVGKALGNFFGSVSYVLTCASINQTGDSFPKVADIYWAEIEVTVDAANSRDEYTATWFKNGVRVTTGITVPTIQVVKRVDGTDLIAAAAMTQIGTTGSYKFDTTVAGQRLTAGEAALAIAVATIDGSSRGFSRVVTRDSTA